jgi:uncharacterized membrane protein YtjA (UPF0391 family)
VRPKKEIVMTNKSTYYLVGFGCGSLAGLLFAPKAGAATRAGIAKAAKKRRRLVKEKIASTVAAMERCRIGTLPSKRIRALFQWKAAAMLNWALIFLIVAIIAGIFGFAGLAVAAAGLAKFIFFLFLILFLLSLLTGLGRRAWSFPKPAKPKQV